MVTVPTLLSLTLLTAVGQTVDLRGSQAGERLGATLVCGPELDHGGQPTGGDGPYELLIGAPGWDAVGAEDAGAVIWVPDIQALMGEPGGYIYLDEAHISTAYAAVDAGARFGTGLDFGDVDGDGSSEILVGAPGHNWSQVPNLDGLGRAYLLPSGGGGTWADDPVDLAPLILEIGTALGPVEAELGADVVLYDADGDGLDDLLALAPTLPVDQLAAGPTSIGTGFAGWLDAGSVDLAAPTAAWLDVRELPHGFVAGDGDTAGHLDHVQKLADVDDGPGHELAVIDLDPPLSDDDPGAVYLFFTETTAYPSLTYATDGWLALVPETAGDGLGRALAFGDVTGDGEVDLLVGAPGWHGRGALAIFPGPHQDPVLDLAGDAIVLEGSAEGSQLGWSVIAEDIDGDGVADAMIGAPAWDAEGDETSSEVLIVFGGPALALTPPAVVSVESVVRFRWTGEPRDGLGAAICGPGDVDGDGLADLAIGAPDATPAAGLGGAGRVWLALTGSAPDADGDGVSAVYDCDDSDPAVHPARPDDPVGYPAAPEICDLKDNDCDGALHGYEVDADGDGWMVCQADCDDSPEGGAAYQLDDADGDGYNTCGVAEGTIPADADLSQVVPVPPDPANIDCDDTDPEMHPGYPEPDVCDDKDNDCDGTIDEDGEREYYLDEDHDGYGGDSTERACWSNDYAEQSGDCNDLDPEIHPGAEDPPNDGIDQDCDGTDFKGGQPCVCSEAGHPAAGAASVGLLLGLGVLGLSRRGPRSRRRWSGP